MHELGIAQGILDIVAQHVPAASAPAVRQVRVRVGALAGVVPDSLAFCFDAIVAGTPYGTARLQLEHVPTVAACRSCGNRFDTDCQMFVCPACASPDVALVSGTELQVVDIEIDDAVAEAS